MTAATPTALAFQTWKLAELAAHYATPCPDEVMDRLTAIEGEAFDALMAAPAMTTEDGLLKAFPLLLRDFEPRKGEPPLRPSVSKTYNYPEGFADKLAADLSAASPVLQEAMTAPHRSMAA